MKTAIPAFPEPRRPDAASISARANQPPDGCNSRSRSTLPGLPLPYIPGLPKELRRLAGDTLANPLAYSDALLILADDVDRIARHLEAVRQTSRLDTDACDCWSQAKAIRTLSRHLREAAPARVKQDPPCREPIVPPQETQ